MDLPNISLPEVSLPEMNLPEIDLPEIDLPEIDLPTINLPDLSLSDSLNGLAMMAGQLQAVVNAAIAHPFWAIAFLLFGITLIQIVADLIKRSIQAALTALLKLPLALSRWIWQRTTNVATSDDSIQMHSLLDKIERLHEEQTQAIAQLKQLVANSPADQTPAPPISPSIPDLAADQPAATEDRSSSSTVSPEVG